MDWMYLFYFLLALVFFFGAKSTGRGNWNEEYTSLKQTKILQGITALGIALHHMAQKTCASWHPSVFTVHGLDFFIPLGYLFVGVFLFCSGLGLYKSFRSKPAYLKGFFRRRILPIVTAFYLSEFIYTGVRLLMGEKMDLTMILWNLSGLHMANANSWYVIVIPFFYLAFWTAFRSCKKEGAAIFWVFVFTLGYTVFGAFIDHQSDWWMQGEWWYNSILLFPLGMLFGKFEKQITRFFRKGYWFWLLFSFAALLLLFRQSEWLNSNAWGYYGQNAMKVPHRLMSAGMQWLVCIAYVAFCFLLMMKVVLGNRVLAWLGGMTLEFYLMHGLFVELFGYSFLDVADSLVYIRTVPVYIAVVLVCSAAAALLFRLILQLISAPVQKENRQWNTGLYRDRFRTFLKERKRRQEDAAEKTGIIRKLLIPCILVLVMAGFYLLLSSGGNERVRIMNGMEFQIPENYVRGYTDARYVVWKYEGTDKKLSNLVLDAEIRDGKARHFRTADEVQTECECMTETELYVNPNGVRMVRGFADYDGGKERRYYIEGAEAVMLMCMKEDERYYSPEDCEEILLQVAENVRPVH